MVGGAGARYGRTSSKPPSSDPPKSVRSGVRRRAPSWPRISGRRNLCARCSTTSTLIGGNIARSTSPSTDHGELPPAGRATTRRLDPDGHAPRRRRARDTRQASWVNRSRTPAGRLGTPARSAGTIRPRAPQAGSTSEPSRLGRRPPSRAVGQLTTDRDRKGRYPQPANQPSPEAGAAERSKPTRLNRPQRHTGRGKQVQRKTAS